MDPTDKLQPAEDRSFYVTGGTLPPDAPSYIERQADQELFQALCGGDYCYVLTSRQMGKSSLCVRTIGRLREEGIRTAFLDLTKFGSRNLTAEQWYAALLAELGRELGLRTECLQYWKEHPELPPVQRLFGAITEVALTRNGAQCSVPSAQLDPIGAATTVPGPGPTEAGHRAPGTGHLVVFIDEIDITRSLPFNTDEFFAAIRQCYVGRATEAALQGVTFCLLGTATPAELIEDTRISPFNIGRRIEVRDFTPEEAAPLAWGLAAGSAGVSIPLANSVGQAVSLPSVSQTDPAGRLTACPTEFANGIETPALPAVGARRLLERILYWTGGHPYLTQRLCRAIVEAQANNPKSNIQNPKSVDEWCEALFFSPRARERDDNLLFVREHLLRAEVDLGSLLQLYAEVRSPRQRVPDSETNRLATILRLSGIARERDGCLCVRNRIYARVFDQAWITANMPDAELRRLRALARDEARKRRQAEDRERALRRSLYVSDMNLAQQAWDAGNVGRALELLETHRPKRGEEDLRGFEWRLFWRLCQQGDALHTWSGCPAAIHSVAYSPDGQMLAAGSHDGAAMLWDVDTKQEVDSFGDHPVPLRFVSFTPDGLHVVSAGVDGTVQRWAIASRQNVILLSGDSVSNNMKAAISPDGEVLAIGGLQRTLVLFDLAQERRIASLTGHALQIGPAAFSSDGKTLATGSSDSTVKLWDIGSQSELASLKGFHGGLWDLAFSPDGKTLATGGWDSIVRLWDVATRRQVGTLRGHKGIVDAVAFSPDGQFLASTGDSVRLWDLATQRLARTLRGHQGRVLAVAFSPDGSTLATGGQDQTVKLWPATATTKAGTLCGHGDYVWCLAFSPDGLMLATGSYDNTVRLWAVSTEKEIAALHGHDWPVACVAFSPDGKILASGTGTWNEARRPGEVRLWDVTERRELMRLPEQSSAVYSLAFSPDGALLATLSGEGIVKLWDVVTWKEAPAPEHDRSRAMGWTAAVLFSPDGRTLAWGRTGYDPSMVEKIQFWDIGKRRPRASLGGQVRGTTSGAFSPDARTLVAGNDAGTVTVWDVAARRSIAELKEPAGPVYSVALSPDARTLAVGYLDANVRLWDMAALRQVATLSGHDSAVTAVAFSPDGNILASASADATVRLWRAAPRTEIDG